MDVRSDKGDNMLLQNKVAIVTGWTYVIDGGMMHQSGSL